MEVISPDNGEITSIFKKNGNNTISTFNGGFKMPGQVTRGRAEKGSRRHIQDYVNEMPKRLSMLLLQTIMPFGSPFKDLKPENIEWVSPLQDENYLEYRDGAFLAKLGLSDHNAMLKEFWPNGGPSWDALGVIWLEDSKPQPSGVILVEAKAHLGEFVENDATGAKSESSLAKIKQSLDLTRSYLGVDPSRKCWSLEHYQVCNRLAHLYFMNEILKVPTWLVWFLALDDREFPDKADYEDWDQQLKKIYADLGLPEDHPLSKRIVAVYGRPLSQIAENQDAHRYQELMKKAAAVLLEKELIADYVIEDMPAAHPSFQRTTFGGPGEIMACCDLLKDGGIKLRGKQSIMDAIGTLISD